MSTDSPEISRRKFLKAASVGALAAASGVWGIQALRSKRSLRSIPGEMMGANSRVGHLLRTGVSAQPTTTRTIDTVIVGGGISGLSAAWWFKKKKFEDFVVLEMDTRCGGNSVSGANSVSAYPWGAHYVPLPGPDAHYVREFFQEIGIIQGYQNELPVYNEFYLCADAHERLLFQGGWQEGLVPSHGIQDEDRRQYQEFFSYVESLKGKRGSDRKFIFNIPMELSSQDAQYLKLDRVSMADFMRERGWNSRYLNWYVNYCCRDDYGMPHDRVSAWAGLHYFASRSGAAANADSQTVLTWPEGNGFLVEKLQARVRDQIVTNALVFSIQSSAQGNQVDVLNTVDQTCTRYLAKNVIYCGPRFAAKKVIRDYSDDLDLDYAPWMVANITLSKKPTSSGAPLAWDNVSFYSPSLGYIVANHQELRMNRPETVLTYYLPLDRADPRSERLAAYQKSREEWLAELIPDLENMHPGITASIRQVDVWVWGHGMVSPGVDYLWSGKRKKFVQPFRSVQFAHSDMSGISIFEEAQYRGVEAAKAVLKRVRA